MPAAAQRQRRLARASQRELLVEISASTHEGMRQHGLSFPVRPLFTAAARASHRCPCCGRQFRRSCRAFFCLRSPRTSIHEDARPLRLAPTALSSKHRSGICSTSDPWTPMALRRAAKAWRGTCLARVRRYQVRKADERRVPRGRKPPPRCAQECDRPRRRLRVLPGLLHMPRRSHSSCLQPP